MKIAVCIKQVPTREWQPRLNDARTWIREGDASYEMNEPDAYALEEGLRLREKQDALGDKSEVVVCAAGPARVATVIREALARGADRAIHVEGDGLSSADASVVGRVARRRHRGGAVRSRADGPAVRRPGTCAGRRRPRGAARRAARDHHHGAWR